MKSIRVMRVSILFTRAVHFLEESLTEGLIFSNVNINISLQSYTFIVKNQLNLVF